MSKFVIFGLSSREEARLTHVKVEAFQTAVPEANDWIFFADVTLGLVFGSFSSGQSVEHRQPD